MKQKNYDKNYSLCSLENLFVVGASNHRTTELLDLNNWQWNIIDPYPNVKDINSVKIVSYDNTFYVFGGYANNQVTNDILCFKSNIWSKVGSLISKRVKFSVISNNNNIYVIGGHKKQKYEVCTLKNTVNCDQDSTIDFERSEEPVLFGISKDGPCDLTIPNYKSKETKQLMILSNATFKEADNFVPVQKTNFRSDKHIF